MNWGYKIILGYVLFAAFVFTLVFKMITSGNDLLKPKYFKSGTQVNEEIQLHQASLGIENRVSIHITDRQEQKIEIRFDSLSQNPQGAIELICLSSDKADLKLKLNPINENGIWIQKIKLPDFHVGRWLCEIRGNVAESPFLIKKEFTL